MLSCSSILVAQQKLIAELQMYAQIAQHKPLHQCYLVPTELSHDPIVSSNGCKSSWVDRISKRQFILLKLCTGGNLAKILQHQANGLPPPSLHTLCRWGYQLCTALAAMHEAGFVHRDVTARNVFFESSDQSRLLLGDVGEVCRYQPARPNPDQPGQYLSKGTPPATQGSFSSAPEGIISEVEMGIYSPASDVYAAGCILYQALTSRPFTSTPQQQLFVTIPEATLHNSIDATDGISRRFASLLKKVLSHDPAKRPAASRAADEFKRLTESYGIVILSVFMSLM
jgi:serine/threonine protein kinase